MLINSLSIIFIFFGTLILLFMYLDNIFLKQHIRKRLNVKRNLSEINNKPKDSFNVFLSNIKEVLLMFTPIGMKNKLEDIIKKSASRLSLGDLLLIKCSVTLGIAIISFIFLPGTIQFSIKMVITLCLAIVAFIFPNTLLRSKAKERRKSIESSLINFVDYLTIAVEAGLSLDNAIFRVLSKIRGPLAEELAKTMTEIKYGKTKREAFLSLSDRVDLAILTSFISALISGEELGISLGKILRGQGEQMREKRKHKIQEKAYKIPVKMTFPLVLFILPGLFIVILGPIVLQVIEIF